MPAVMPKNLALRLAIAALIAALCSSRTMAAPLLMVFRDKPPYSYVEQDIAKGFLLERTRRILARANILAEFREMPPKRIFFEIQKNEQEICSFGWYKIAERQKYARYSVPLHQDRKQMVMTGARSAAAIRRHTTLKNLMSSKELTLATADGVSYGTEIDQMISAFSGKIDRTLLSPLEVAKKVALQRADFMFIDQDDYDYLLASDAAFLADNLVIQDFPDTPPGLLRYILCSQKVSEAMMKQINAAIALEK
jgi:polar amino acid transport system substrate-binding protein